MPNIQVQHYKNHVSCVCYIHISDTKYTVLDLFNVWSNHAPLNYSGQESEQFAVYDSDTPATLK